MLKDALNPQSQLRKYLELDFQAPVRMKKLLSLIKLSRPHQYTKNTFVFLPIFFGYKVSEAPSITSTLWAFVGFSFIASAVYILNDIRDMEEDRAHPKKKLRPLASGQITQREAFAFFSVLILAAFLLAYFLLPVSFSGVLLLYLLLNIAYSLRLKKFPIVDVVCIAVGFVLRVFSGGIAAQVKPSHWLILMTFLLSLFIAVAKRRDDMLLSVNGKHLRKSLSGYNLEFASHCMMLMAAVSIVSYILYVVSPEITVKHGTTNLYLTTFWVILGFMRYMQQIFVYKKSGSPTEVVIKDKFLQLIILLWLLSFFLIIYVPGI